MESEGMANLDKVAGTKSRSRCAGVQSLCQLHHRIASSPPSDAMPLPLQPVYFLTMPSRESEAVEGGGGGLISEVAR